MWRYEKKFILAPLDLLRAIDFVESSRHLFRRNFPARGVNNLYFDTPTRQHYHDNERGVSQRTKVRIRWYGERFAEIRHPMLELKIKRNELVRKVTFAVPACPLAEMLAPHGLEMLLREAAVPARYQEALRNHAPCLVNAYRRFYFTGLEGLRATVDDELCYAAPAQRLSWVRSDQTPILEIKIAGDSRSHPAALFDAIPFHRCKSSKYVAGMQQLHRAGLLT